MQTCQDEKGGARGFPGGSDDEESACNVGDLSLGMFKTLWSLRIFAAAGPVTPSLPMKFTIKEGPQVALGHHVS